jgi:hypothetical protein
MNRFRTATVVAFATLAALNGAAAAAQAADEAAAALQAVLVDAKSRLDLTPEQEAQMTPVIRARNEELKAIRDRHAGDTSRRARRAMFGEARPVVENYLARVRTILTDAQYGKWEQYREAARDQLKEQYKSGARPQ